MEPRLLAELAARAQTRGWDGFFLWDHIVYREPVQAVADPWVALAAIACSTDRIRLGITPREAGVREAIESGPRG